MNELNECNQKILDEAAEFIINPQIIKAHLDNDSADTLPNNLVTFGAYRLLFWLDISGYEITKRRDWPF